MGALLSGDGSDSEPQSSATGRIAIGGYTLELGDRAGSTLVGDQAGGTPVPTSARSDSGALRRALARRQKHKRRTPSEEVEAGLDDAADVMAKIERALTLFTEIASLRLDPKSASDEIDGLTALVARLDREGRCKEALRLARNLSLVLALIGRWIDLVDSLHLALAAAEKLGDPFGEGWVEHELGSLHLAAGRHADADRLLSSARATRERCGDRAGLTVTNRNLQVLCQTLRQLLHRPTIRHMLEALLRRPALALVAATTLLALGGAVGVVLANTGDHPHPHPLTVAFSFVPSNPHTGQSIVFSATASDPRDPVASYTWQWGDGDPAGERIQRHEYRRAGRYTVVLSVRDAGGRVTGHVARSVVIRPPTIEDGPNAYFFVQPRSPAPETPAFFDASSSFDPRASIDRYEWSFGDGHSARGVTAAHRFAEPRTYKVSLTVTDSQGQHNTLSQLVTVAKGQRKRLHVGLECASSTVLLGQPATVSGAVAPQSPGTTVTVTYRTPAGKEITRTLSSDAQGAYQASAPAEELGVWTVQSTVPGDSEYQASTSEPCTFTVDKSRPQTTIHLDCPTKLIPPGEAVTASGTITPSRRGATVTVTYRSPSGEEISRTATSNSEGAYQTSAIVEEEGGWTVQSKLQGDSEYQPGASEPCEFSVGGE